MSSSLVSTWVKPVIWFRDARSGCCPVLVLFPAVAERAAWLPTGNKLGCLGATGKGEYHGGVCAVPSQLNKRNRKCSQAKSLIVRTAFVSRTTALTSHHEKPTLSAIKTQITAKRECVWF